ncbi:MULTISPECIES: hypothetical protein [Paraburkholderia]|uniref:Uncharacterized protein n=1 Tax=Paraburkholderia madseniana TaxID=2599607 RepID=A0AAP5BIL2_9BURK|nr:MULTISPECIES: hypothetical protein [Paraburkholderia]MCX4150170.1 hypothetical protein [Paraburkholderia madseniana]MDN7153106.1 hypothetical protein [Paraburkholderia sp. WS6]MDQ6411988.1 hypothetical protein [Paraburkholderia madseniana]
MTGQIWLSTVHHDDHSIAGFVLVILGMMVGFFAGRRIREYGMIGVGGMMGLVAYLILDAWGWLVLIGVWVALIAAQWAMDVIEGRRQERLRRQCGSKPDDVSQRCQATVPAVQPQTASGSMVEVEVPDIALKGMSVVEVLVKEGDTVEGVIVLTLSISGGGRVQSRL